MKKDKQKYVVNISRVFIIEAESKEEAVDKVFYDMSEDLQDARFREYFYTEVEET